MNKHDELLDYESASCLTGIKVPTLYSLVSKKQIPHIRLSKRIVRFSRTKINNWIQQAEVDNQPTKARGR